MIEVNKVIDGSFEPKDLFEVLQASVLMEDMQASVNKGKTNVFGWVLTFARIVYAKMAEAKAGWNDPSVTWYQAAAAQFHGEAQAALTAGEIQYSKKQLDGFKNAVRTIHTAMKNGADLLEQDEKGGGYKLRGKTQLEQWNKDFKAKQDQAEHEAHKAALVAQGFKPAVVGEKQETGAETNGPDALAQIADPEVRVLMEQYIKGVVDALNKGGKEGVVNSIQKGIRSMEHHIKHSLTKHVREMQKAANG